MRMLNRLGRWSAAAIVAGFIGWVAPTVTQAADDPAAPVAPAVVPPPAVLHGLRLTNDRAVDCTSNEAIIRDLKLDGLTDQQKSLTLWKFFIQRNMHKEMSQTTDNGNAAELMTKTGYALCGNWGHHYAQLAATSGLKASSVYLNGHVVAATHYWDDWHMFDADMWAVYPKADGVIASPDEIRTLKGADGRFILREGPPLKSFPWYEGPDSIGGVSGLYDKSKVNAPYAKRAWKWNYDLSLRPGQSISWSWYGDPDVGFVCLDHLPTEDCGKKLEFKNLREYLEGDYDYYQREKGKAKWNWGNRRGGLRPNPLQSWNGTLGNGRVTFDLSRNDGKFALQMAASGENVAVKDGKIVLANPANAGSFTLDFAIPYSYGDAWIEKTLPEKGLSVEVSVDGKTWQTVFADGAVAGAAADDGKRIRLFDLVRGKDGFQLKFTLAAGAAAMTPPKAIGAFVHTWTALPGLQPGKNTFALASHKDSPACGLMLTMVYDHVNEGHELNQSVRSFHLRPDAPRVIDTSDKHWPLMRSLNLYFDPALLTVTNPGSVKTVGSTDAIPAGLEQDWGALPWDWCYYGVNWWNDFERGDRQGWAGQLSTENTYDKSDFCLNSNLKTAEGKSQFKFIRSGAFLNRDTKFRCLVFVKNVKEIKVSTRHQDNNNYYGKTITDLKQGEWQPLEFSFNDLTDAKHENVALKNNDFLANVYLQAVPAEGAAEADVEYRIDNTICYDGELKHDPFKDPDAAKKALQDDPVWNAKPPAKP